MLNIKKKTDVFFDNKYYMWWYKSLEDKVEFSLEDEIRDFLNDTYWLDLIDINNI